MLKTSTLTLLPLSATLLSSLPLQAAPVVVSFERFHADSPSAAAGALLYNELGCANCHSQASSLPKRQGPDLTSITARSSADWVRQFLLDPQTTKPGSAMPHLLADLSESERAEQAEALLHYLYSLSPNAKPKFKPQRHANAERGSARFHQVGCVACHSPTEDFHPATGFPQPNEFTYPSVPLPDLNAKYSLLSLAEFISEPAAARPDGRMPHIALSTEDITDIACHLMDFRNSDAREAPNLPTFKADKKLATQGREIAERLNCAACHQVGDLIAAASIPTPNPGAASGCLSAQPAAGHPHYDLSPAQRDSLQQFLAQAAAAPKEDPKQLATLTLQAFNCYACHSRDGIGGPDPARDRYFVGDEGIADAGRLPPPLGEIGQKLRKDWMLGLFAGKHRARPYVMTQMPNYPQHAEAFTALLKKADKQDLPALAADPDMEAGHKLVGIQGGLNCVTCHSWGEKPSLGIQALDISELNQRLTPEWFRHYLLNPAAYRPGTLMPPLWPGGQSMLQDVLGGDTEKQIAAIWAFIAKGEGLPLGYPDHITGAFELIPQDRAIIQRTFLNNVGSKAIVIGFPGGINMAYNGETAAPALAWKGRFFDAYSTWFVRAAPFEDPLETEVFSWPAAEKSAAVFKGYKLDSQGNPIFLLQLKGQLIEDYYQAIEGQLERRIRWPEGSIPPNITHPEGLTTTEQPSPEPNRKSFRYSWN